jgi:hypothetical protein
LAGAVAHFAANKNHGPTVDAILLRMMPAACDMCLDGKQTRLVLIYSCFVSQDRERTREIKRAVVLSVPFGLLLSIFSNSALPSVVGVFIVVFVVAFAIASLTGWTALPVLLASTPRS